MGKSGKPRGTKKDKTDRKSKSNGVSKARKLFSKTAGKIKEKFDVFANKNHENQYSEYLSQTPSEDEQEDEDPIVTKDIVLIDSEDDSGDDRSIKTAPAVISTDKECENIATPNELDDNTDFISLKFDTSSEEEEDQEEGEEDTYSIDDEQTNMFPSRPKVNSDTPWIKDHDHSTQREVADWLTMEIKDFIAYISPSKEEIELRNATVRKLREKITAYWTDCEVLVFGSYATDLYLPGSDIDMVINSGEGHYDNRNSLYELSSYLKREGLAKNIEVIAKTKVPIIKFTEPYSGIHIDVSFERTNGVEAARVIRRWLGETPGLRELVLIIKQFLGARKLNNVRVGGLGGYSIICLCYSFLTLHPRLSTGNMDAMENLGVLLIEFFELYGRNFSYDDVALCVDEDNVSYLQKKYYPNMQGQRGNTFGIAIQDPSDPTNNISRGSFNVRDIRKAFGGAYELLINTCYDLEGASYKERLGKSILGNVIKYKGSQREFCDERDKAVNEVIEDDSRSIVSRVEYHEDNSDSEDDSTINPVINITSETNTNSNGKVEDYMGLPDESDEEEENQEPPAKKMKKTSSIDKESKREFWLQKGNKLA